MSYTCFNLLCALLDIIRCLDHPVYGECDVIGAVAQEEPGENEQSTRKFGPELSARGKRIKGKSAKEYRATARSGHRRRPISDHRVTHQPTPARARIHQARHPVRLAR